MKRFTLLSLLFFVGISIMAIQGFAGNNKSTKNAVEVANLGELRAQEMGETVYLVTGEVVITHIHGQRNQKYIQDDTGAIVIDDPDGIITTEYNLYDGITGVSGTLSAFQNLLQFRPAEDPGEATSADNIIEPLVITLNDIQPEHQAMLIRVNEVEFVGDYTTFNPSTNYNIEDPSGTGILRTPSQSAGLDYFGTDVPEGANDMVALVSQYAGDMQIFPRSLEDIYLDGVPIFDVTFSVIDEEDVAITDAVITFDGTTYDAGEYFFADVFSGIYNYTVEKTGYFTRTRQVTISGEDITVIVVLVAESPDMVDVFPWDEDFEGEEFPPLTWSHYAYGPGGWASTPNANSGQKAAFHDFEAGEVDSWLVSPQIQLPEEESMLFKFFQRNAFMNRYDYSGVKISTGSGNPQQNEFVEVFESSSPIANYSERIINLSDYAGKVIYIAFVYQGDNAHQWFIDDISVEEAPEAIEVDNIAALYDAEVGDLIYQVTGEVFITHQQQAYRGQMYIQDGSAAIMIDDNAGIITTEYNNYDGLVNIKGTLSVFQNMLQFVPVEDPGPANSTGNTVEPMEVSIADLNEEMQGMLVLVRNVSFDFDHPGFNSPEDPNFAHNRTYIIYNNTDTAVIRTPNYEDLLDYYGEPIPTEPKDLIGVLHQRWEVTRLQPRSLADFLEPTSIQEIEAAGFNMFPNPAVTHFNISGEQTIDYVRLYNMNGQLVMQEQVNNSSTVIDVSVLKTGIYIVQVIYGNNRLNYKLQIQK